MSDGHESRARWDFSYLPVPSPLANEERWRDGIVATRRRVVVAELVDGLSRLAGEAVDVQAVVERTPLFWYRVRASAPLLRADVEAALRSRGVGVRYAVSAVRGSMSVGPLPGFRRAPSSRPRSWRVRGHVVPVDPPENGRWFLRGEESGVAVDRAVSVGAHTRLAVIDDAAAERDRLDLDAEVLVQVERASRSFSHGSVMIAWAVGCRSDTGPFYGVAPGASPRLYLIPKAGVDVTALPAAIVRAADDGADVVVCATYVDGGTSPMMDDALEFAARLGRRGRGAIVVFPTGREGSSFGRSVHASWSLGLGEPASDPRAMCIAPGGRGGGWFLWRDRVGLRPFANRGPAVRWTAPGDDIAHPFHRRAELTHAESSGASAIASGVLLNVISANPTLRASEIEALVTLTCARVDSAADARRSPIADPSDIEPHGSDPDGHNAKTGYGHLQAGRAALFAADPVAASLVGVGEEAAAQVFLRARRTDPSLGRLYTKRLGRFLVRALLADASAWHGARALARHARLVSRHAERPTAHHDGAFIRAVTAVVRQLLRTEIAPMPKAVRRELRRLDRRLVAIASAPDARRRFEAAATNWASSLFVKELTFKKEAPKRPRVGV